MAEIYRAVYFSEQMVCRYKFLYAEYFKLVAVFSSLYYHFHHRFYCRVSTDAEDQINSYRAQVSYYTEHISQNPKWRFVEVYADEGITGTMVKKRENFLRMIKDCEKGKIDMILTKSVSRFARNIVDSISYVRKLKAMGIGIYFE